MGGGGEFASTGANSLLHMLAPILEGFCRPERQTRSRKICPHQAGAGRLGGVVLTPMRRHYVASTSIRRLSTSCTCWPL